MLLLTQLHSVLRWTLLIVLVFAIVRALMGMLRKDTFGRTDDRAGLVLTIFADFQLLLGLVLWVFGNMGLKNIQAFGMATVMKNSFARFFAVEHITMMLLAVVLIHVGRALSKRGASDAARHKKAFWFYLIALLMIFAAIPWPFRPGFELMRWI